MNKTAKKQIEADHYLYSVGWSEKDNAFVARVAEFPSLAAHGKTQEKALREIRLVVEEVVNDLSHSNAPVPEPFGTRSFSGRLVLRMPEYLHRNLAIEAVHQGVSLNQLLNLKLERNLGK